MKFQRRFFDPTYHPREKRQASILACVLFWSVLSYFGISRQLLSGAEVVGNSMVPNLANGDRVFLNRLVYRFAEPERGDVVALDVPDYDGMSVKRVIALPGETVQIRDATVFVNGRPLAEPYLPQDLATYPGALSTNVYRVDPDCYFVLGDNRGDSLDSRSIGAVCRAWIRGRVAGEDYVEYKY